MKLLETNFRRDGLLYTQLKRNDIIVLYSVSGTSSDRVSFYEVCKIYKRKPDKYCNYEREAIPNNEQFGKDLSRHFINYNAALKYFDELSIRLNLLQGVSKVVTGVEEKPVEVFGYQLAEI